MSKIEEIVEMISGMTLLEVADLVKALEEKFGVTAAAPMAFAGMMPGAAAAAPAEEEQTEFDVILKSCGAKKIQVLKVVRELTGLGLKEAKDLVDNVPKAVKEKITKEEAKDLKEKLEKEGAEVEIK